MPKKTLIVLPDVNDIQLFKNAGQEKSNNDEYNKIRENVLTNMFNIDDEYFNDPSHGEDWKSIHAKFIAAISTLCELPFSSIKITHMGGMTYNYDFTLEFLDENKKIIKTVKLEFKHNNSDVSKLVQFMELFDKDCKDKFGICSEMSYAEYYYDNYLDKYLETDETLASCPKPDKSEYLRHVSDIKYKHPFFDGLYKAKENKVKEKKDLANVSVTNYLQKYSATFQFHKVTEKIRESQTDKVFLLWDCENFHIQKLNVEQISITGIKNIEKLSFTVNVDNFQYDICIRLRWANNNGLANPAWKFSFVEKQI